MKPSSASAPAPSRRQEDPSVVARRMANYIRLLEFLVAAVALVAGIIKNVLPFEYLLVLAILLGYPLVAQTIAALRERKAQKEEQIYKVLVQLDAIFIGIAMASLHFALIPCMALLIIVHANAVTSGGLYIWLMNIVWTVLGAVVGALVLGFEILAYTDTPILLNMVSMVGLGVYVGAASFQAHQRNALIMATQARVYQQQKQAVELSRKLAKYLSPQIWGSLFSGKRDAKVETRRKKLTIFFSDIKGFSAMSEELPLNVLTSMLNTYLSDMTRIAMRYGGTVDKFIGDAVMVFFGDPTSKGSKEDATNCVAMAIEMQKHMKLLRQKWKRQGIDQKLEIRIGINTGYVTVGNFGTDSRLDYTILGTDVNLASPLESAARPGHILISEATHELIKDRILARNMGDIQVKGFNRPIPVFEVSDWRSKATKKDNFVSLEAAGFAIHMDVDKIRHFDKKPVLKTLATTASKLKQREPIQVDYEAEGFALHVDSSKLRPKDIGKIMELMGRAAMSVKAKLVV